MKKLVMLLIGGLCLFGCGRANYDEEAEKAKELEAQKAAEEANKETTTVCDGNNGTITFYAKGDKIEKEERHVLTDLSEEIAEEADYDELIARINNDLTEKYGNLKGVEFQTYWEENTVHTIITVDYKTADKKELDSVDIIDDVNAEAEYISLEQTLLEYQKKGYACGVVE